MMQETLYNIMKNTTFGNLIRQGTGSAALLKVALLASHMLVVYFSFAVLLLLLVSHVISCTFLMPVQCLSSSSPLHLFALATSDFASGCLA